jgi:tRNA(Ile)-lysidine synthase
MDRPGALRALRHAVEGFVRAYDLGDADWCVALSGGADSLALTAVVAAMRPTTALIVDHGLQAGSAEVAATARAQALQLGCVDARVLPVTVGVDGGPEAAARTARYTALDAVRGAAPVFLGHTLDDQAETVLLGLGRGSGPRSISGMRSYSPPWCRPLLSTRRADTRAACDELGVTAWCDPHNDDPRFRRSRLRAEVLPLLEDVLGGGVASALARTADALREDTAALDAQAEHERATITVDGALPVDRLGELPAALRRRVIRGWLLAGGATGLTDKQIRGVDVLISDWRGQGGVAVASALRAERLFARRRAGRLELHREPV